jgi:hypothetical protein
MGKVWEKIKTKVKAGWSKAKPYLKSFMRYGAQKGMEYIKYQAAPHVRGALMPIAEKAISKGKTYAESKGRDLVKRTADKFEGMVNKIPSMAKGGLIRAAPRVGKIVRLHKGELVVPAKKVRSVMHALRKAKIEVPIARRFK